MDNTRHAAKNVFTEGLVMDIAPEVTPPTVLTSALNATLISGNGNEMLLQNDMGNGRVETARLPNGYIPIGSCEFGDIIYIISYNPLIDKTLIGCFPSPERNITSDEISQINSSISSGDFLKIDSGKLTGEIKTTSVKKIIYEDSMSSGDKYIIYTDNQPKFGDTLSDFGNTDHIHNAFPKLLKLHVVSIEDSGKIIYLDSTTKWYNNNYYLQEGITSELGELQPDLDSYRTLVSSAYSIFSSKVSGKLAILAELEKIQGFSCTWDVKSITEGNIAEISNNKNIFYNTYDIDWHLNWVTANNNINPSYVVLTESKWFTENPEIGYWELNGLKDILTKKYNSDLKISVPISYNYLGEYYYTTISRTYMPENNEINYDNFKKTYCYEKAILNYKDFYKINKAKDYGSYYKNGNDDSIYNIKDDIVNNLFHYPVIKNFHAFKIPIKQEISLNIIKDLDISSLKYLYELTPAMPYGLLREFSQKGIIDFSKIGKKNIKLNTWKYYNQPNTCILNWGLEAYTEPNKGISEVVLAFYDPNGLAATYITNNKSSYNGNFIDYLPLNGSSNNIKLTNRNIENTDSFCHPGNKISKSDLDPNKYYLDSDKKTLKKGSEIVGDSAYEDDSGILYSNFLYAVKIIVKYCDINTFGEYVNPLKIEDVRWLWTNGLFNENYYNNDALDFETLQANLNLDVNCYFESTDKWKVDKVDYFNTTIPNKIINSDNYYETLSAKIQHINSGDNTSNLKLNLTANLQNNFNTFNIDSSKESLDNFKVKIIIPKDKTIINVPEQPEVGFSEAAVFAKEGIYPTIGDDYDTSKISKTCAELLKIPTSESNKNNELWDTADAYKNYKNGFNLSLISKSENLERKPISYISSNNKLITNCTKYDYIEKSLYDCDINSSNTTKSGIDLQFTGIYYSKFYSYYDKNQIPILYLKAFVAKEEDLKEYNIEHLGNVLYFNKAYFVGTRVKSDANPIYNGNLLHFQYNSSDKTYRIIDIIDSYGIRIDKDIARALHDGNIFYIDVISLLKLKQSLLNATFKFLFPIGFGYRETDIDSGTLTAAKKDDTIISSNKYITKGDPYNTDALGGTIASVIELSFTEPGDHMIKENILTHFMPIVLGYLTNLYTLTTSEASETVYLLSNYIFLKDNYSLYTNDVVVSLSYDEPVNNVNPILLRGIPLETYVKNIEVKPKESNNIDFTFTPCMKTYPLLVKFNYEQAEVVNSINSKTNIQSIYTDMPKSTTQNLDYNLVYYYNANTKKFSNIRNAKFLNKCENISFIENTMQATRKDNNNTFVPSLKDCLKTDSLYLEVLRLPNFNGSTYNIQTTQHHGKAHTSFLSNFKTGLKYYE